MTPRHSSRLRDRALPPVLRRTNVGLTDHDFVVGTRLRRSTPKISGYLAKTRPHVVALNCALAPAFGGESALAQLDKVKGELDAADTQQEVSIRSALDTYLNRPREPVLVSAYSSRGRDSSSRSSGRENRLTIGRLVEYVKRRLRPALRFWCAQHGRCFLKIPA